MTAPNLVASSGSPITPVDARNTSAGLQPAAWAAMLAVSLVAARPDLPVKALALPELTTSARAAPPLRCARHQSTGAPAMAAPGGGGRQFDARHRRHIRKAGGRERGNGGCHGVVSLSWPERTA